MDARNGRFEKDPAQIEYLRREHANDFGPQVPFPELAVGEIVEIKGVSFRVCRIKADGKLGLKMCKRS